jgi:hypothetical protein
MMRRASIEVQWLLCFRSGAQRRRRQERRILEAQLRRAAEVAHATPARLVEIDH